MRELTLGSLFSGSGGFELAGQLAGMKPIWNSEIAPFAIAVTRKNFPDVKHYGDVAALNGAELEPVDIITFGSPCQDMSVAGKRAGLDGSRSRLFYEAIRIITEMRKKINGRYPRYAVWENVPGAFSSNGGEDFRAVLEAFCSIKIEDVYVPGLARWPNAGEILADGFSLAWRVLDAQYWGVPQRRKRIYLVADFAGGSAGKILFESEGLSGYSAEGFRSWQRAAGGSETGSGNTGNDVVALQNHGTDSRVRIEKGNTVQTLTSRMGTGGNNVPLVMATEHHAVYSLKTGPRVEVNEEQTPTLMARDYKDPTAVAYGIGRATFNSGEKAGFGLTIEEELQPTLVARGPGAVKSGYTVRRLTPTECARLQGFPDCWCSDLGTENPDDLEFWTDVWETHRRLVTPDSKPKTERQLRKWLRNPHSDAAEYKLWGNGIALPCAYFVLSGIVYYAQFPTEEFDTEGTEFT